MILPSRVAGRTLGLRGPDLALGPEVARPWFRGVNSFRESFSVLLRAQHYSMLTTFGSATTAYFITG